MALLRLFDPTTQFQTKSGALNVAGRLRVFIENTDDLANIYGDDGSLLSQPLLLDNNGRARGLFVDSGRSYRLEAYDRNDSLLFTIRKLEPNASGTIVNPPTVFIKGTPDEIDVEDSVTEESRTYTVSLSAKVTGKIAENREAIVKESEARKGADDELRKMIDNKQSKLSDGDNVHIDEAMRINVVNRKTLMVKSPLTTEKNATALVIGIRNDAFASSDGLAAETEARTKSDSQLLQRIEKVDSDLNAEIQNRIVEVSKKQDKYYLFNSNTSTVNEVQSAITEGRTIVSSSGSNFVTWQGFIHGNGADLVRVERTGGLYSWHYVLGKWESEFKKLSMAPTAGKLVVGLNGTATLTYYDWTFAFTVNSLNASNVNIRNPNVTSADIFSETRTYGNSVRLVGADLSSGKDIIYCGNGDFNTIPTRIVMDIFDGTNWLELRMMQYTSGSNLVIDYRIGGFNG